MSRWQLRAACRDRDTTLFYEAEHEARARAICATCPVQDECLDDDLAHAHKGEVIAGVRAGLTEAERRDLYRRRYPTLRDRPTGYDVHGDPIRKVA